LGDDDALAEFVDVGMILLGNVMMYFFISLYGKHLARRDKKHDALVKVIVLLAIFHLAIEVSFERDGIEIEYQAKFFIDGHFYGFEIDQADEGVLRFGEAHLPVILTHCFYPGWLDVRHYGWMFAIMIGCLPFFLKGYHHFPNGVPGFELGMRFAHFGEWIGC
jgi:hypothetical protein